MKNIMNGSTDRPIETFENDEFAIDAYIEVLSEFIEECETPMTIAVQGDWGCGKTSMMNMVRQYLKRSESVIDIWFNTWQFSQFSMDDKLVITFLQYLVKVLTEQLPEGSEAKKAIGSKLFPIMKTIAVGMTKHFAGSDIGDMVDGVIGETENKKLGLAEEIFELKKSFQDLIQKISVTSNKRVVVFIDDLDRLQPVRAVELLEVLKLFLDCDNCVFVMAIDTSVVFQGIREKYGKDMSNEKAQSFFDKMIQLPFKMPTAYYQLDKMLVRLLDFLNDETMSESERKKYIAIIREVTDGNPRTIKRLANAVLLMDKVAIRRKLYGEESEKIQSLIRRILVVLACVQLRYETTYGFLVNNINYGHMNRILNLRIPDKGDANRGKLLLTEFCKIGMPEEPVNGELVFFDLMYLFIDLSREFVCLFKEKGNTDVSAVKKLMQVVSLNNIRDAVTESNEVEALGLSEQGYATKTDTADTAISSGVSDSKDKMFSAAMYTGMIEIGHALDAYNLLTEKRIYPRIHNNMRSVVGSFEQGIVDLKEKRMKPEESYLFHRIDEVLRQSYQTEGKHKIEEEENFKFEYFLKNDERMLSLTFVASERSIEVWLPSKFVLSPDMKAYAWYEILVEEEKKEYQRLQSEYGTAIFPDIDFSVDVEYDENGTVKQIGGTFYVVNEAMADLLTEFLSKVSSDADALKKTISESEEAKERWNRDSITDDLLQIAKGIKG